MSVGTGLGCKLIKTDENELMYLEHEQASAVIFTVTIPAQAGLNCIQIEGIPYFRNL